MEIRADDRTGKVTGNCGRQDMVQGSAVMTGQLVFLLGRSDRKSVRTASQRKGAASQNGTQSICKNIPCLKGKKGFLLGITIL